MRLTKFILKVFALNIPFFKPKKKNKVVSENENYIVLDIGTEFVKTAIFYVEDNIAKVIGYSRVPQHSNAMEGAMIINIANVISACENGIGQALSIADSTTGKEVDLPRYVVMGIAGELVKGISIVANYERENPDEKITADELDAVVSNIKEQAFIDSLDDIAEEIGSTPAKIKEISSHINSTYIDDVKVDDPIGFTGQEVSYRVYSTFAPSIHINSLYEIASQLDLEILGIEVQPYAISRAFKGAKKSDFSSIFIDIGGGTTDIAVVDHGGIVGTRMMAFGGRVFTKRIAKNMNLELDEAEKMKIRYSTRELQEITEGKIRAIITDDTKLWTEGVEISLTEFEEVETYPSQIFICGGGSELPDLKESLMSHPWLTVLPFDRFPKISHIYPNQIQNVEDKTKLMITSADVTPTSLVSVAIDLISKLE